MVEGEPALMEGQNGEGPHSIDKRRKLNLKLEDVTNPAMYNICHDAIELLKYSFHYNAMPHPQMNLNFNRIN